MRWRPSDLQLVDGLRDLQVVIGGCEAGEGGGFGVLCRGVVQLWSCLSQHQRRTQAGQETELEHSRANQDTELEYIRRSLRPFRRGIPGNLSADAMQINGNSWRIPRNPRPEWTQ